MYQSSKVCIKLDSKRTDFFKTNVGVKQGEVVSPFLFNLYINDIPEWIGSNDDTPSLNNTLINCLLYADDLAIFSTTPQGLQCSLDLLGKYCDKWRLAINTKKTKVIQFTKRRNKCLKSFKLQGDLLENVDAYKYLGVVLSSSCSMYEAIKNIRERSLKAVFKLKSCLKDFNIAPNLGIKMFMQLVKPVCMYGSEIWFIHNIKKAKPGQNCLLEESYDRNEIENFFLRFCKYLLGLNKKTSNVATRGELGASPICIDIIINSINFWKHLYENENQLLVSARSVSEQLNKEGKTSWHTNMLNLSHNLGLRTNSTFKPDKYFIKNIKQTLKTRFSDYWRLILGKTSLVSGKLSTYKQIKQYFQCEDYIKVVKNHKHRRALAALRTSSHQLLIERGRYQTPVLPRESRLCVHCDLQEIEDEKHFILTCTKYNTLRNQLFNLVMSECPLFTNMSAHDRFIYLMNSGGTICKTVAKFCFEAMETRNK
jgi:hypothetical protein